MPDVSFYFDPGCPWTWMTSRWLVATAPRQGSSIVWRSFSLAHVNRDTDVPEQYRAHMEVGRRAHRVIQALRDVDDNDAIGRFYEAIGTRLHRNDEPRDLAVVGAAAVDAGLSDSIASAVDEPSWDAGAARDTEEAIELAGPDVGSPVLRIDGAAVFGPIIDALPDERDADRLWDAATTLADIPSFHELKRGRRGGPDVAKS
ncbi:MAG: DsbA family protein [Acidimicrobiales bacterium]